MAATRKLLYGFITLMALLHPWRCMCREPLEALWRIHRMAGSAAGRVVPLILAGIIYRQDSYMQHAADSTFLLAQQEAAKADSDSLLFLVYSNYLSAEHFSDEALAAEYCSAMAQLGDRLNKPGWVCIAYSAQTRLALDSGLYASAGRMARQAFNYAALSGDATLKAEAWLLQGIATEREKAGIDAFRCYLSALYLAEETESDDLKLACYAHLSDFYAEIRDYEKAGQLKLKELSLYQTAMPYDTSGYMDRRTDLAADYFRDRKPLMATAIMREVLAYSRSRRDEGLTRDALEVWRSTLISLDRIAEVEDLYCRQFPEELTKLEKTDLLTFYRLKAYFSELDGNNSEAKHYYLLAEAEISRTDHDATYRANFYRRYGQFLLRAKAYNAGENILLRAEALNDQARYLPYAVNISSLLDSAYKAQGYLLPAYAYAHKTARYMEEQAKAEQQDKLLLLELDHETRARKLEEEREDVARHRRHSLQYMGITLIILSLFIGLVLLGSFKPRKWVIRALGFITFIMLFEFIILLLDHRIAVITHEEPWKMLGIKIVLIAFLLPFHHWVEEKVVHYLYAHHLTFPSRLLRRRLKLKDGSVIASAAGTAAPEDTL